MSQDLRELLREALEVLEAGTDTGLINMSTIEGRIAWNDRMRPIRERIRATLSHPSPEAGKDAMPIPNAILNFIEDAWHVTPDAIKHRNDMDNMLRAVERLKKYRAAWWRGGRERHQ